MTPRASREALTVGTPEHFAARLTAPPIEGAANQALVALVAKQFGVAKRAVALISGETARLKRLRIAGDTTKLEEIVASLYGNAP